MSKKLLMNTDIETSSVTEYITDGLILHLDAISNTRNGHDYHSTSWEDLSGNNNDFRAEYEIIFNRDKVCFRKKTGYLVIKDFSKLETLLSGFSSATLEILFDYGDYDTDTSTANYCPIFVCEKNIIISFGIHEHAINTIPTESNYHFNYSGLEEDDCTFSAVNYKSSEINCKLYKNGTEITTRTYSLGFSTDENTVLIGSNWDCSVLYAGNIKSIRLYNRALTQEEIQQNRLVDEQRFELNNINKIIFTPGINVNDSGEVIQDTVWGGRLGVTQSLLSVTPSSTYEIKIKGSNYLFVARYGEDKTLVGVDEYMDDEYEILTDSKTLNINFDSNTYFVRLGTISHLDYNDAYDVVLTMDLIK